MPTYPIGQTFRLLHDGARGPYLADSEVPSGYNDKPTTLVAPWPYEFYIDFYEYYAETAAIKAEVGVYGTGKVYCTVIDSGVAAYEVTLAACNVEASAVGEYNRLRVSIPAGALPSEYIGPDKVRLIFEMQSAAAAKYYGCYLDVYLVDGEGESSSTVTITTGNETVSIEYVDTTQALTAVAGRKLYIADSSPYAITLTLPAYDAFDAQYIEIMAQSTGEQVTVQLPAGTFLGTGSSSFTISDENEIHALLAVNDAVHGIQGWMHLNWRVTSR